MIWQDMSNEEQQELISEYENIKQQLLKLKGNRIHYNKDEYDLKVLELQKLYNDILPQYRCDNCRKVTALNLRKSKQIFKGDNNPIFCSVKCSGQYYANKQHKEMTEEQKIIMRNKISNTLKHKAILMTLETRQQISERAKKFWDEKTPEERSKINKAKVNKIKETKMRKYEDENYNNRIKAKNTCMKIYGVDEPLKLEKTRKNKALVQEQSNLKIKQIKNKQFSNPEYKNKVIDKIKNTNLKRYGVTNYVFSDEYIASHNIISKLNKDVAKKLNILEFEKHVSDYRYDLHRNSYLIDINPTISHNVNKSYAYIVGLSKNNKPIDIMYHYKRTQNAIKNHYKCIHIFDWDDIEKIKYIIEDKQKDYANNYSIKEVSLNEAEKFLDDYSITNIKGSSIYLGLFKNDDLYQLISIGKHLRSTKWEYEIFNFQTLPNYEIIGGYEKLIKYFIKNYKPKSICTYVDISKFTRKEFEQIGFLYRKTIKPKLWIYENKIKKQVYENYKDINQDWLPVPDCGYYLMYYKVK